jgi:hypothetical protein
MKDKPKSRRRRLRSAKSARQTHVVERHGHAEPPPEVLLQAVPITIDGRLIGEVRVQPGTEEEVTTRAVATLADLSQWSQLGVEIADLGEHRLKIAARAARVAAAGGLGVSAEEEAGIADWFRGIVQTAIERGGVRAARAIWFVLVSDNQRDPRGGWTPRCSALETIDVPPTRIEGIEGIEPTEVDEQEIATWLAEFPDVAASYIHHAVACATTEDVTELRRLIHTDDDALDAIYAPEPLALAEHDPHEAMYEAMSVLTRRRLDNAQASGALENWAFGSQNAVQEHAWEPPVRVGICAWLARVALRHEEQAA